MATQRDVLWAGVNRVLLLFSFMLGLGTIVTITAGKPSKDIKDRQIEMLLELVEDCGEEK